MDFDKTYTGTTEDEIWQQITPDIDEDTFEYHALIQHADHEIILYIDIDAGGGFEGGYATTGFSTPISNSSFKFAIHEEHFTDEIGKFFGMQDIEIGYPELDHHLIIKTNDEDKIKTLFADPLVREIFTTLENFDFGIHHHSIDDSDEKQAFLELNIEDGITDIDSLRKLYHAFYTVLLAI
jgi:hypothetical protein